MSPWIDGHRASFAAIIGLPERDNTGPPSVSSPWKPFHILILGLVLLFTELLFPSSFNPDHFKTLPTDPLNRLSASPNQAAMWFFCFTKCRQKGSCEKSPKYIYFLKEFGRCVLSFFFALPYLILPR